MPEWGGRLPGGRLRWREARAQLFAPPWRGPHSNGKDRSAAARFRVLSMMNAGSLPKRRGEFNHRHMANPRLRRLSFTAASLLCLIVSVSLLYNIALLHFAIGSWAFLNIPKSDPRLDRNLEEIAFLLFQIVGGVSLAVITWPAQNLRRCLKWSPVFIIAFAALTWIAAWALSPWQFFTTVGR